MCSASLNVIQEKYLSHGMILSFLINIFLSKLHKVFLFKAIDPHEQKITNVIQDSL